MMFHFRTLALAAIASLAHLPTHAVVALPTTSVFDFTGICDDCVLTNPNGLIGRLTLSNYSEGTAIDTSNFVSFEYFGSNIVDPYVVAYNPNDPFYIYGLSGSIDTASGNSRFEVTFEDGLKFSSTVPPVSGGSNWYTCGRGVNGYYSGTCNIVVNQDFGTGEWSAAVPEPATWLTFSAGLMVLGMGVRRQQQRKQS